MCKAPVHGVPKKIMKIAIAQINTLIGDFDRHFNRVTSFSEKAKTCGCDLVVFPELTIPGSPALDLLKNRDFIEANLVCMERLVESVRGIGVICGYVDKNRKNEGMPFFNSALLFEDGVILHTVHKQVLSLHDVFDETRYFEPGGESGVFSYRGSRIGLTVGGDLPAVNDIFEHKPPAIDPAVRLIGQGANLIVNISALPFYAGKHERYRHQLGRFAKKNGVSLVCANQVGGNDSLLFDGASCAFDEKGDWVAQAKDFKEDLVVCDTKENSGDIHDISGSEVESIFQALVMGTYDYVTKCGFSKALVGLSGGVDSALVAAVAVEALGKQNVSAVSMPSRYTSRESCEEAAELARNLGIELLTIPIDGLFQGFTHLLSPSFTGENPGIVEQNLQSRIRGTILMALSNRYGSLLLASGNKSELAMGYCTLYGDMNGALGVIADVYKTIVYQLVRFYNRDREIIPERIIRKAPSAELKPGQKDEDDLPPYDILDRILKGYVEENKTLGELVQMGLDQTLVRDVISRVDQNEYKRRQAAPGLNVTKRAFGYGRGYPVAQKFNPRF